MGFNEEKRESFSKFFKEVSSNGFENINKRNEEGETILHQAVEISDYKTVRLLINKGTNVNARDKKGYAPLHCAVFARSLENVKVLIRGGGEVNATQYINGCTPLHSACRLGAGIAIIKELVKAGANIEQKDKFGKTAMYYTRKNKKIIEVLENVKMANKQREFIEKIKTVSESTAAGVKEELVDGKVL
ncbi:MULTISPECIES: ankyrin repeat domain-containing protein [unclassified Wolbachia]|nr:MULTISPECIES: ankyrin repeat domain-containing protein [unclassified Wolbachia]